MTRVINDSDPEAVENKRGTRGGREEEGDRKELMAERGDSKTEYEKRRDWSKGKEDEEEKKEDMEAKTDQTGSNGEQD
ncbi:hypothetical protein NQZ68_034807 [Dissostichus eleginoides]|nr:hypothetical protein NQZ68_034807 [Dissostichus eleginoides]